MTVADHLPQAWFDVDERRRQPALPLARVLPMIDLRAPFLDEGIDRFQAIRRLERTAQDPVHAESMQREGLLQAFLKARSGRLVSLLELSMELFEGRPGFVVLRALVRTLKPLALRGLLGLRQVAHHVLAFVPLAALDQGSITECPLDCRAQTFAAVDDHQHAFRDVQAALHQ